MAILALANTSCTNIEKLEDPELEQAIMAKLELYGTDFSTTSSIPIDIQAGRKQVVRIYAGDPNTNKNAEELITLITDQEGNYQGRMTLANTFLGTTLYAVGTYDYYAVATASKESTVFYGSVSQELSRAESTSLLFTDNTTGDNAPWKT